MENPNLIFSAINMFFSKKIKDIDSKFNYDCYNSLLFENMASRLVKRPDYLDTYSGPEAFQKMIEIISKARDEVLIFVEDGDCVRDVFQFMQDVNFRVRMICEDFPSYI